MALVWGSRFPPLSLGFCFDVTVGESGGAQETSSVLRVATGTKHLAVPNRLSPTACCLDARFFSEGDTEVKGGSTLAWTSDNSVRWSYDPRPEDHLSHSTGEGGVGFPCSPSGFCRQACVLRPPASVLPPVRGLRGTPSEAEWHAGRVTQTERSPTKVGPSSHPPPGAPRP